MDDEDDDDSDEPMDDAWICAVCDVTAAGITDCGGTPGGVNRFFTGNGGAWCSSSGSRDRERDDRLRWFGNEFSDINGAACAAADTGPMGS